MRNLSAYATWLAISNSASSELRCHSWLTECIALRTLGWLRICTCGLVQKRLKLWGSCLGNPATLGCSFVYFFSSASQPEASSSGTTPRMMTHPV